MRDQGFSAALVPARVGEYTVDNRYRQALAAVLGVLTAVRGRIATAFDLLAAAARTEAWQGRSAQIWYGEVESTRVQAVAAVDECLADCGQAWARQPEQVPADDPRARHPDPPPDRRAIR